MFIQSVLPRAVIAAALILTAACSPSQGTAQYAFATSATAIPLGESTIDVNITHGDKPVIDAVIFELRFDMSPDGMGAMTGAVTPQPSNAPGVYRFIVKPTMAGRWQLTLSAKVQGEADTVKGSVVVTAR